MDSPPKKRGSLDQPDDAEAQKLFQQFRNVFGNEIGTDLYYALNSDDDSDEVAHLRIEQMMAEMNELTDSSDTTTKTTTTVISPDSTDLEQHVFEETILQSPTSSSSMFAICTPSPLLSTLFKHPTHLKAPAQYHPSDSEEEGITLTEIVEIHRVPSLALITIENNNFHSPLMVHDTDVDMESQVNNNNTSCSLSSTLTDSKTLDVRTPIVV